MSTAMNVAPAMPSLAAQTWSVAVYELRRLIRARHALPRFGVLLIPFFMALFVAGVRMSLGKDLGSGDIELFGRTLTTAGEQRALALLFRVGNLRWIVFLAAAGLFGGMFSGERTERTLHHVFLQPIRRETLTVGKYVGGVMLLWSVAVVSWILTTLAWMTPHGAGAALGTIFSVRGFGDLLAYVVILLLAAIAYGGVFLLAGAVVKSPPLVALALIAWEGACAFLPVSFQRLTVFYWLDSLLPLRVPFGSPLAVLADAAPWPLAVLACLLIGAAGVAGAAWRVRSMELAYGASD